MAQRCVLHLLFSIKNVVARGVLAKKIFHRGFKKKEG